MLSAKLIQMIEDHSEQITASVVAQMREDAKLLHIGRLPEPELRERAGDILHNLGHWLLKCKEGELEARYEKLGRTRFEEEIPLHEIVRSLQIIKGKMIDFVRNQGIGQTTVDIYAEEELEHCVDRFFDGLVYRFVRGYEKAMREAVHLPA